MRGRIIPLTSTMKAKENIYLNSDKSKAVGEGSPDQAFLLVAEGSEISDDVAKKYGIKSGKAPDVMPPAEKPAPVVESVEEKPEEKAAPKPANKAKKKPSNKSK